MPDSQANGGRGLYYGWWIVIVCAIGLSTGPGQFLFGSLGLFIIPLGDEFGWGRAEISLALTFFTITTALFIPLAGNLVDRFGSRKVLLPSIVHYAENDTLVVDAASALQAADPCNPIASIKRLMGRGSEDVTRLANALPYELVERDDSNVPRIRTGRAFEFAVTAVFCRLTVNSPQILPENPNPSVV